MAGGVVAVGDSIIHGGFTREQFIAPQSWAQHLADTGDWAFTNYARGLATSGQVVDEQLPLVVRDDYDVGAVTVGANDLQFGWDAERFAANLEAILTRLGEVADRVVVTTVPPTFRRLPGEDRRINQSVPQANDIIVRVASEHGAHVVDLSDFTLASLLTPRPCAPHRARLGRDRPACGWDLGVGACAGGCSTSRCRLLATPCTWPGLAFSVAVGRAGSTKVRALGRRPSVRSARLN